MGDGVLVYFGYPQAHEDDAERAVRAGLAVISAVAQLATAERLLSRRSGNGYARDSDRCRVRQRPRRRHSSRAASRSWKNWPGARNAIYSNST